MEHFADKVIAFNKNLVYDAPLPQGYAVLNPYLGNPETWKVMSEFYYRYYADNKPRKFLVGINPSRHGAGVTGVPFTDTKRLASECGITMTSARTHEISSVFMYDMIRAYGGPDAFYSNFYINSPFPLAIVKHSHIGNFRNANYYDDPALFRAVKPFMVESLRKHISLGLYTSEVFVLGKKNADCLAQINREENLFGKITVLDHPRYIQQYKSKEKDRYIEAYISILQDGTMGDH